MANGDMKGRGRCLRGAACAAALLFGAGAGAQSTEDMNSANNPLAPKLGLNLQDQYVGSYHGLGDADSNAVLFRGILPHKAFCASPCRS